MNVRPVIVRELRREARRPVNYWLRFFAGGALISIGFYGLRGRAGESGQWMFQWMNIILSVGIWQLVPLMTADCIGRERREKTLGLLFLTPLSARDIVLAKVFVHGLRAFSLLLVAVPMLTVPLLLGGVSGREVTLSVLAQLQLLLWALGAGLLASALTKRWHWGMATAVILGLGAMFACFALYGLASFVALAGAPTGWFLTGMMTDDGLNSKRLFLMGLVLHLDVGGIRKEALNVLPAGDYYGWLVASIAGAVTAFLWLMLSVSFAAFLIERTSREREQSAFFSKLYQLFCSPIMARNFLKAWLRWKLDRNPVGWLESRSWSGRLLSWSWLAVIITFLGLVVVSIRGEPGALFVIANLLAWPLLGSIAFTAAGSFKRERESGVLELLLVSPLREVTLVWGRVRGLWGQFFPAMFLLCAASLFLETAVDEPVDETHWGTWVFWITSFLCLPVIGLYQSLQRRHVLGAFGTTLLLGLFGPLGSGYGLLWLLGEAQSALKPSSATAPMAGEMMHIVAILAQIGLTAWFAQRLVQRLEERRFALDLPAVQ